MTKAQPLLGDAVTLGYEPVVAEVRRCWVFWMPRWGKGSACRVRASAHCGGRGDPARRGRGRKRPSCSSGPPASALRFDESERWGRFAEAILERMGPGHDRLKGWLAHNRGSLALIAGELAAAEPQPDRGHRAETQGRRRRQSADVAVSINNLGELYARRGDAARRRSTGDQAQARCRTIVYTARSALVGRQLHQPLRILNSLGRHGEALESCRRRSRSGRRRSVRARLARLRVDRRRCRAGGLHRPGEALAPLRRALDIRSRRESQAPPAPRPGSRSRSGCGRPAAIAPPPATAAATQRDEYAKAAGTDGEGARRRRVAGRARRARVRVDRGAPLHSALAREARRRFTRSPGSRGCG